MTLNERIRELITIKAAGSKTNFAALIEYSPQHLNNILKGVVGLTVVERILRAFPDVDARWLVLGEGSAIIAVSDFRRELHERIAYLMELDGLLPYMTGEEQEAYRAAIAGGREIRPTQQQLYAWKLAKEKSKGHGPNK